MAKSIAASVQHLALYIFHIDYADLDVQQKIFVHRHLHAYKEYRREITAQVLPVMGKKKLKGTDYQCIFCFYKLRIPLPFIVAAIQECHDYAAGNGKAINSIKYFRRAIIRQIQQYEKRYSNPAIITENPLKKYTEGGRDNWMYVAYTQWTQGQYPGDKFFHHFFGPNTQVGWEL